MVEEQAGHCVGKARIKGKVHMKIPQAWDEGLTAAIDGGLCADTLFCVATNNGNNPPVVDEDCLVLSDGVDRVNQRDVLNGDIDRS